MHVSHAADVSGCEAFTAGYAFMDLGPMSLNADAPRSEHSGTITLVSVPFPPYSISVVKEILSGGEVVRTRCRTRRSAFDSFMREGRGDLYEQ